MLASKVFDYLFHIDKSEGLISSCSVSETESAAFCVTNLDAQWFDLTSNYTMHRKL